MKLYTFLLGAALSLLWAIPASALHFDEKIYFHDGRQEVWLEALWFTEVDDEFNLFDANLWRTQVRLTNASFPSSSGTLAINAYDAAGTQLMQIMITIPPLVTGLGRQYTIEIHHGIANVVNIIINNLDSIAPGTRSFGIMPRVEICSDSTMQPVVVEADHVYDGTIVASDELTIPLVAACP